MVSCLRCGAYDDRYCGCWQDRLPGFAVSATPVTSVCFTVSSPTFPEKKAPSAPSEPQKKAQPPHQCLNAPQVLDIERGGNGRAMLYPRGVRGENPPVLAIARSAHTVYEGGGWE